MIVPAPRQEFLGLHFDGLTSDDALAAVLELMTSARFSYVVTPNVDHMVRLWRERETSAGAALWAAYDAAALCLCDSRILAKLAQFSGLDFPVVTGSDLTARLVQSALPDATRVVLIGGTPAQQQWLAANRPNVVWLQHIPPMGFRHDAQAQDRALAFIADSQPDLILFAIGAPQSELLAARIAEGELARGVGLCIGASIEFVTGEKRRAPAWIGRMGLEWAFRLAAEPARLWRRYLIEGPAIFRIWWHWRRAAAAQS